MIVDSIININNYKNFVSDEVVNFISKLTSQTACGKYFINETNYVNIEEYNTKPYSKTRFETHKKYIDIQFLLSGIERLDYVDKTGLKVAVPYVDDIEFYENNKKETVSVYLDCSNFVLLFPNEAHRPQMSLENNSSHVKKVVVKILAENID